MRQHLVLFCILFASHEALACSSSGLMMKKNLVNPDAQLFKKNLCTICLEKPSTVWSSNCGHVCQCKNCASTNLNYHLQDRSPIRCPFCNQKVRQFWTTQKSPKCKLCRTNLALIAHDKCGKLILCQACREVQIEGCPSCKSSGGNRVQLFFPNGQEDPNPEREMPVAEDYAEDNW